MENPFQSSIYNCPRGIRVAHTESGRFYVETAHVRNYPELDVEKRKEQHKQSFKRQRTALTESKQNIYNLIKRLLPLATAQTNTTTPKKKELLINTAHQNIYQLCKIDGTAEMLEMLEMLEMSSPQIAQQTNEFFISFDSHTRFLCMLL